MDPDEDPGPDPGAELAAQLARNRRDLTDLRTEFSALADPEVVALDDEHDSEGSTIGYERARVAGLIERAQARVDALRQAATRLADGTYGRCQTCGGPIGADRLAALPAVRQCIDCARSGPVRPP